MIADGAAKKESEFHCDRAGKTQEIFDIQMPFFFFYKLPLFQSSYFVSG